MIRTILSQPEVDLLMLQRDAIAQQLQQAYRHYYAVHATQEMGDPTLIDTFEIQPLEAEFQRVSASLVAYLRRTEGSREEDPS